jgi:hypothetical protein
MSEEEILVTFERAPLGAEENYDTLDNIELPAKNAVQSLCAALKEATKGTLGVSISGKCALCDADDGYWGRSILLETGEHLQVRVSPRGSVMRPVGEHETRMIATRRTSIGQVPEVCSLILFQPRVCDFKEGSTPLTCGATIGCRGIHVLLPSLFNQHDPTRNKNEGHACLDPCGYHSVRPSTVCITYKAGVRGTEGVRMSMTPGFAYLTMAAHMCATNIADPLMRASSVMSDSEHSRCVVTKQRAIVKAVGEAKAGVAVASALTLCELLSMEGVCGILCNEFFQGAIPDAMHSPIGVPLCIAMSIHIACNPDRFNLPPCTKQDVYVNREIMSAFHSRWNPVYANGSRAIDIAIKSGYDNALNNVAGCDKMLMHLEDSLKFWQRAGQRAIAKLLSDPASELSGCKVNHMETRFGFADLIHNPISEAKHEALASEGYARPLKEAPVDRVYLAPLCDTLATASRMLDNTESWLRTGMYGVRRLSEANVNVARPADTTALDDLELNDDIETSSDESNEHLQDPDDLLDNRMCVAALESASRAITVSLLHGAFSMHQFGIHCYMVSQSSCNKCADCDADVGVVEGVAFGMRSGQCRLCNRKRCHRCSVAALAGSKAAPHCLRCAPEAPSPRLKAFQEKKGKGKTK